jgi:protein RecA
LEDKLAKFRQSLNKKAGQELAFSLALRNPAAVTKWISTGSTILDLLIDPGKVAGIPCGRICEIAGLESSAKSYLAAVIASNAKKQHGMDVAYFDSESSLDSEFLTKLGLPIDDILYIQAQSVEFVLESIEQLLQENPNPMLFILDSLAMCPTKFALEASYDPAASIGMKARIMSNGLPKLIWPLSNHGSTFLILNQLRDNITRDQGDKIINPYLAPGGKALAFSYSLRIWLTKERAKASKIMNEDGVQVGSTIKVEFKKSKFGAEGRKMELQILWGGSKIGILDEESWFDFLKDAKSPRLVSNGSWYVLRYNLETEEGKKFQSPSWMESMKDPVFRAAAYDAVKETCSSGALSSGD